MLSRKKEISLAIFSALMTGLTFWPFAFDVIDFTVSIVSSESRYTSFFVMPHVYWGAVTIFVFWLIYNSVDFLFSLLCEISYRINESQENIDKKLPPRVDTSKSTKIIKAVFVFFTVFCAGLYSLNARFENIKLQNDVRKIETELKVLKSR